MAIVVERYKLVGEFVKNGDQLMRFVDISQLEVQIRVPENSTYGLTPGTEVTLISEHEQKQGTVRVLVPVADVSQLYEARISYQVNDWPAGLAIKAVVPSAPPRQGVVIPRAALVIRSYGINVFRVNTENKVEQVPVKVLYGERDEVEVRADIKPWRAACDTRSGAAYPGGHCVVLKMETNAAGGNASTPPS